MAEANIDAFIASRDRQRRSEEGKRSVEALWRESVTRYEEKNGQRRLWARWHYHQGQARRLSNTLEALVAHHRKEVERYAALLGVEPAKLDETTKRNGHEKGAA